MDLFINIVISLGIGIIALFLVRFLAPHSQGWISITGRINRFQFIIGILFLSATMHIFNMFIQQLLEAVIILPAYFGIKALAYAGYIILLPWYYTLYVRRLNDISIPGFPFGILLGMYIIGTNLYIPLKNTYMLHLIATFLIHGALALLPGRKGSNRYGDPSHWPRSPQKKINL